MNEAAIILQLQRELKLTRAIVQRLEQRIGTLEQQKPLVKHPPTSQWFMGK